MPLRTNWPHRVSSEHGPPGKFRKLTRSRRIDNGLTGLPASVRQRCQPERGQPERGLTPFRRVFGDRCRNGHTVGGCVAQALRRRSRPCFIEIRGRYPNRSREAVVSK